MNKKFLKLARMLMSFAEVKTDKGSLIYDGELAIDTPVQTEDADGNIITAPDGEYLTEEGKTIVVADGKIAEIKEPLIEEEIVEEALADEPVEEPVVEEPKEDERDAKIAELEAKIAEYEATIAELENQIKELTDKVEAPVEEAISLSAVAKKGKTDNPVLKYFEK